MRVPIVLPDLGSKRSTVSLWLVQCGERVFEGDRVVEILIPGVTIDISSPCTGILKDRFACSGDTVVHGQTLGTIVAEETR